MSLFNCHLLYDYHFYKQDDYYKNGVMAVMAVGVITLLS